MHLGRGHRRHARVDIVRHLEQHRHPAAARDVDRAGELAARHDLQRARQLNLVVVIVASDVVEYRALDYHGDGEDVHTQVHRVYGYRKFASVNVIFGHSSFALGLLSRRNNFDEAVGPTLNRDVIRSGRRVDVLKDVGRRVLIPTRDAGIVSVVDCDVQGRGPGRLGPMNRSFRMRQNCK